MQSSPRGRASPNLSGPREGLGRLSERAAAGQVLLPPSRTTESEQGEAGHSPGSGMAVRTPRDTESTAPWGLSLPPGRDPDLHGGGGKGLQQAPPRNKPRPHLTRGKAPPLRQDLPHNETLPHLRGKIHPEASTPPPRKKHRPTASHTPAPPLANPALHDIATSPAHLGFPASPASSASLLHPTRRPSPFVRLSIKPRLRGKCHPTRA